ncbi:uncharacterized protein AB675_4880 [Cyphellophora attinorum]|uniref:Uncharacterized protein n=1 Tax=Cyphellophora attinorum TaxID=1664694 RepID=A0A0N1NVJ8_9EURO|nr:uncharacterized protein AB675_4880 [Phialophora attinorum]KPI34852.1 hypothetical protein AB675_4880 [Phialophora attinorum]
MDNISQQQRLCEAPHDSMEIITLATEIPRGRVSIGSGNEPFARRISVVEARFPYIAMTPFARGIVAPLVERLSEQIQFEDSLRRLKYHVLQKEEQRLLANLRSEHAASQAAAHEAKLDSLQRRFDDLMEKSGELENWIRDLQTEKDNLNQTLDNRNRQITQLHEDLATEEVRSSASAQQVAAAAEAKAETDKKIANFDSDLHQVRAELKAKTDDVRELERQYCKLTEESQQLQDELEMKTDDANQLEEQHRALTEEHQQLQTELKVKTDDASRLEEQHRTLRQEHESLKDSGCALEEQFRALNVEHKRLQFSAKALSEQIAAHNRTINRHAATIISLEQDRSQLRNELRQVREQAEQEQQDHEIVNAALMKSEKEWKDKAEKRGNTLNTYTAENNGLKATNEALKKTLESQKAEMKKQKKIADEAHRRYTDDLAKKDKQINEQRTAHEQALRRQEAELKQEQAHTAAKLMRLRPR